MPTKNRGQHPNDHQLFSKKWLPILKEAVDDMVYLLTRGYTPNSSVEIVGNRYQLNKRQRMAILRISSSESEIKARNAKVLSPTDLRHQTVFVDGFNLLIILESAMSGAYIFKSRDGTYRDISGVHGSYKRVRQTESVIKMVGNTLVGLKVQKVKWLLDKPISNSGRLKQNLEAIATANNFNWEVALVNNPDKILATSEHIVISADGWVLDHAARWFNLGALMIEQQLDKVNIIAV
ncbi:MAG: DUF434 domain-containing protein [Bacteroidota bacterium]